MRKPEKLLAILRVAPYRSALLQHGVAAAVEHRRALGGLGVRTVVDVGANRGQFALLARHCFPRARIIAFEPLSAPAVRFRRLFADDGRVTLHRVALGSHSGEATMHVSGRDDSSSLLPITAKQRSLFPGTGEAGTETVRIGRLSEFIGQTSIERPALLKLDVQGYELEALRGSEDLLEQFDWVSAECSFLELYEGQALADEVIGWLCERGFRISSIDGLSRDRQGRAIQADILFARP